ncbi:MAG: hypothetical protein J6S98_00370, partial [Lentisphaeria bacterium]|nr:hypothetical protein [Lentisphaeria bacterium]
MIDGSTFTGNKATTGNGGAVYIASSDTTDVDSVIRKSTFDSNTANYSSNSRDFGRGGGVYAAVNASSTLLIEDSTFRNNSTIQNLPGGGGLFIANSGCQNVVVDGSKFIGNTAGYGGGIALLGSKDGFTVFSNLLFDGNHARYGGGGIFMTGGWSGGYHYVTAHNLTIVNNTALWNGGGMVATERTLLHLGYSTFVGNRLTGESTIGTNVNKNGECYYGGAGISAGNAGSGLNGQNHPHNQSIYIYHSIFADNTVYDGSISDIYHKSGSSYYSIANVYSVGTINTTVGKQNYVVSAENAATLGQTLFGAKNADGKYEVDSYGLLQLQEITDADLNAAVNREGFRLGTYVSGSRFNLAFSTDNGATWLSGTGGAVTATVTALLSDQTGGARLPYSTAGAAQYKPALMWSEEDGIVTATWTTIADAKAQLESGDGEYYFAPKTQDFGDVTVNGALILHGYDANSELAANFILADATDTVTVNGMKYAGGATISAGTMTVDSAMLTGAGNVTVNGGVFTVVNTTVSGYTGTITVDASATAQVVHSTLYGNSGTITGNGALNILNTLVFGTENLSGYTAKFSVFDIAGTDAYNTYSATAADVFGSELVWDGLVLTTLQETAGSTAPHSKGALAAINGGNLYYSTDNMNWKNFADDSAATVDSAYIIAVDALGNPRKVMSGNASVGVYASLTEAASLMVTIATDVVDRYDGYTSLREAILYAQNGEVAVNFDSNGDGTMDTYRITFDAAAIFGNTETRFIMRNNEDGRIYVDLMVNAEGYSSALAFTTADNFLIDGEDQNITIDISQGSASRVFYQNSGALTVKNLAVFGTGAAGKQSSADRGGLVQVESGKTFTADKVEFAYSKIAGNDSYSGAVYTADGTIILNNSDFHDNSSGSGAAVLTAYDKGKIYLNGGRIHNNTNANYLVVSRNGGETYLTDVEIDNNKITGGKELFHLERSGDYYLDGINVHDNTSKGAFLNTSTTQSNAIVRITNSSIYNNTFSTVVAFGSGASSGEEFTLGNTSIYNNTLSGSTVVSVTGNADYAYAVNVYNNT